MYLPKIFFALVSAFFLTAGDISRAQCNNWTAKAVLTTSSGCSPTGTVQVVISGPDAANLSNLQYGMPMNYNGFSVPLGSSPIFSGLQADYYRFSAIGLCNGVYVGRNTALYVPAGYFPPQANVFMDRASLSCGTFGQLGAAVGGGVPPFRYTLTSYPPSYTGPTSVTTPSRQVQFDKAPAGNYTVVIADSCQNTVTRVAAVGSINEANIPLNLSQPAPVNCDSLQIFLPVINGSMPGWSGYTSDSNFKVTTSISGGIYSSSVARLLLERRFGIRLPAGKTLKDCYGQTITFTITMPCGQPVVRTLTIATPSAQANVTPRCNLDFDADIYALGPICMPIAAVLRNIATNRVYGPYTSTNSHLSATGLPFGNYQIGITTGDGYTISHSMTGAPVSANPYSVSVVPGSGGVNGFAGGFEFRTTGTAASSRTVELFSGPAGYYYSGQWYGQFPLTVNKNMSPAPGTVLFPVGSYVWKITDDCGVYYLTAQVQASDLYQFVLDSVTEIPTCSGLQLTAWARSWRNGVPQADAGFLVIGHNTTAMPSGTPVLLRYPGSYMIMAASVGATPVLAEGYYRTGGFSIGFPNTYNSGVVIDYVPQPLSANLDSTQGFICPGAAPGSARIQIRASGGIPFRGPAGRYYKYELANHGSGARGPYIATNTTGIFTGFNGVVNAMFDVRISDSCGDTVIRTIRILDLERAGLITGTEYVVCRADSIRLSALYLPNATYSWTGPNGFSSGVREPLIAPLLPAHSGLFRVTINTSICSGPVRDTSVLAVNDIPPKPRISLACDPRPPVITVTNPVPGHAYMWRFGYPQHGPNGIDFIFGPPEEGNSPFTRAVTSAGRIAAVAVDSLTGCESHSDTLEFDSNPAFPAQLTIAANRLKICTGDTTTLVVAGITGSSPGIQWFRNGTAIAGATKISLAAHLPGTYRVAVDGGLCSKDTSPAVQVQVVSPPQARLLASDTTICDGDTAFLHTLFDAGYTYSWSWNNTTVPGAFDSSLRATQAGTYSVIVSNGGCIVQSPGVRIHVTMPPTPVLIPATDQSICPGQSIRLRVAAAVGVTYSWSRDSVLIPGADTAALLVSREGTYRVIASTPVCPSVASEPLRVRVLRDLVRLPADTTICNDEPFSFPLSLDTGFIRIGWSTGSTDRSIDVVAPGLYWVRGEHRCGSFSDSMHVYTYRDYFPAWPSDTIICNPTGAALLRVPKILRNVRWSTGAAGNSLVCREPGRYTVEGESPCGMVRDSIEVAFCAPVIRSLGIAPDTICVGDCIRPVPEVDNYPRNHYWAVPGARPDTGWTAEPGAFCFERPGLYTVALRVSNPGGEDEAYVQVVVADKPQPRFRDTLLTAPYRSRVVLPACAGAAHVDWYRNDSLICGDCPELALDATYYYNTYKCVLRNASCPDSCNYALRVVDIPHEIWMPDAFTPNADGRNDVFGIITDNPNVRVINFEVYNRWGQRVFVSNLNNGGWDGTTGSRAAEMGSYFWQLRYRVLDKPDVTHHMKGDVTLIR